MSKIKEKNENLLIVSSSPHIRVAVGTHNVMMDVIIALLPVSIASVVLFGIKSLLLILFCVGVSVLLEYVFLLLTKQTIRIKDCSAAVTGLILALNLPVTTPLFVATIGCIFAVIVTKQLFGGIGKNFANPAIVGRIILLVSFPVQMSNFVPTVFQKNINISAYATPLVGGRLSINYIDLFLGNHGGTIGETCALALLIGFIYLVLKRIITPTIPLAFMGSVFLFAIFMGEDALFHLLSGGVMLGAIFMATDYVSSPSTELGKLIFGIGAGVITMTIRLFGGYPEGVSFAILFMNVLTPLLDRVTRPRAFGEVKNHGEI